MYRPQQSCGKVMFLHPWVILFTGGVSVPACTTGHMTGGGLCPGKGGLSLLLGRPPMYGNERAVRILPECILVSKSVSAV